MKLSDQRLLLDFSRLMLRIAQAQAPGEMHLTAANVHRSRGHKAHRAFFLRLSPRKRELYRRQLQQQIAGVAAVIKQAEERGEVPDLTTLTIEIFDAGSGKPIRAEDAPAFEPAEPDETVQVEQQEP